MEKNLSLFNQINSLSYWFLYQSNYRSYTEFDAELDEFFISIKKDSEILYSYRVSRFSKKNRGYLEFELRSIVNQLLYFKDYAKAS